MLRESGLLPEGRRYFFLQPLSEDGWLIEQTDFGWQVSKARKVMADQTFLRSYDVFDRVTLSKPLGLKPQAFSRGGEPFPLKISSSAFGTEFVSLAIYEKQLSELILGESIAEKLLLVWELRVSYPKTWILRHQVKDSFCHEISLIGAL